MAFGFLERGVMIGYKPVVRGITLLLCVVFSPLLAAESLGNLAQYPPRPIDLQITTGSDGAPNIEPSEIVLDSGQYYRLTIDARTCRAISVVGGLRCPSC